MGGRRGRIKGRQKRAEEGVSREEGRSRVEEGGGHLEHSFAAMNFSDRHPGGSARLKEISNSIFLKIFLLAEVVWGEQGRKS